MSRKRGKIDRKIIRCVQQHNTPNWEYDADTRIWTWSGKDHCLVETWLTDPALYVVSFHGKWVVAEIDPERAKARAERVIRGDREPPFEPFSSPGIRP